MNTQRWLATGNPFVTDPFYEHYYEYYEYAIRVICVDQLSHACNECANSFVLSAIDDGREPVSAAGEGRHVKTKVA